IISTPNGRSNRFASLWLDSSTPGRRRGHETQTSRFQDAPPNDLAVTVSSAGNHQSINPIIHLSSDQNSAIRNPHSAIYYKSKISIHDAVASGLPLDIDELRRGLGDDEAWRQEYLCEFADNST